MEAPLRLGAPARPSACSRGVGEPPAGPGQPIVARLLAALPPIHGDGVGSLLQRGGGSKKEGGNTANRMNSNENGPPLGRWDGGGGGDVPIAPVQAVARWLSKLLPLQLQRQKYEPELGEYE